MQISVDLSPLLVRSAGVKTYLYHWYRALRAAGTHRVSSFPALLGDELLHHEGSVLGGAKTIFGLARLAGINFLALLVKLLARQQHFRLYPHKGGNK